MSVPVDRWHTLSAEVVTAMADWRAQHPRATFSEIDAALDERLARLRAQMLQDTALSSARSDGTDQPPPARPRCPDCDQPLPARGVATRHRQTQGGQELALPRRYGTCPSCGDGLFPLDEELGLLPGSLTPRLLELLVRLGAWLPFAPAAELLTAFTAVACSAATARRQTETAGAELLAQQTAAAPALAPPADPGPPTEERLQLSADGAMVALTDGTWAEVRTAAIGRVCLEPDRDGQGQPHTREVSYFSRLASAEEFTRLLVVETHRRRLRAARAVAGVNDGALWLQSLLDYHCSDAVRILDLPHALEHGAAVGRALWGAESAQLPPWLAAQARQLKEQGPGAVLAELRALVAAHPEVGGLAEPLAYLEKREAEMNYPAFGAAEWSLGSGVVESANKLAVEARLKGAGMRWAREQVTPLLALRNAVCNDRWAEVWPPIARGLRKQARQGREPRRAARPAVSAEVRPAEEARGAGAAVNAEVVAEVEAILTQVSEDLARERAARAPRNGKPGASHPWRRSPIGRIPHPVTP